MKWNVNSRFGSEFGGGVGHNGQFCQSTAESSTIARWGK